MLGQLAGAIPAMLSDHQTSSSYPRERVRLLADLGFGALERIADAARVDE